jgi:uncharacterized protein YggE
MRWSMPWPTTKSTMAGVERTRQHPESLATTWRVPFPMPERAVVSVVGEGTATGTPDRCIVYASLNAMAESVADAVSQVAALGSQVSKSLRGAGVDAADIRTMNLSVSDVFDQGKQKVTARVASYSVEVTVRQLERLGEHLAQIVSVAGDSLQVRALRLTIADTERLMREARSQAMDDARDKAEQLTASAGARLGRIVSIDEGSATSATPYRGYARTALSASSEPIAHLQVEPGSMSVSCKVAVTYELSDVTD